MHELEITDRFVVTTEVLRPSQGQQRQERVGRARDDTLKLLVTVQAICWIRFAREETAVR